MSINISKSQSISEFDNKLQEKYLKINDYEEQIEEARRNGNLLEEIKLLQQLMLDYVTFFGDNKRSYLAALQLEKLIQNHPEIDLSKSEPTRNQWMGMLLRDQSRFKESLEYFKKAEEGALREQQPIIFQNSGGHIGEIYYKMNEHEKAIRKFNKLLVSIDSIAWEGMDVIRYKSRIYEFKAEYFENISSFDSACFYAKKSIYAGAQLDNLSARYSLVARLCLAAEEDIDSVLKYAKTALDLAHESVSERITVQAHQALAKIYEEKKDYKNAYDNFTEFYALEQKQRSFDDALEIGNINLEREREASRLQKELADERLSNQKLIIWIISGGLLLLVIGLIYIFRQLKLIRKQNKVIEQEKFRAERSERYKEQFLANMSHEIRTPMHAISGMLNAIRRQPHPKTQDSFLNAMKVSADNLLVILNDVLDMSKIESGNLDIEQVPMSIGHVIKHVVNVFKFKADEKGLDLKANIVEDFPQYIIGDPGRLNQILLNLVSNAIKFTENGSVSINVQRASDTYRVEVVDTGTGLSKEEVQTVFESFKQGENVSKGKQGGTGLGLAICKQLIGLQNGLIGATSDLGKGSTFYFELPLIIAEDQRDTQVLFSEDELKQIGEELAGMSILIAEDNPFNIMVVNDDLTWYIPNVELTFAENGNETINKFKSANFDIILMDVQMPEVDGYEATRTIRKIEREKILASTPIIAMTASLLKDQIDKCYEAGMDAYVPKPYKPEELILTLKKFIIEKS